jgi:hypothetical protein
MREKDGKCLSNVHLYGMVIPEKLSRNAVKKAVAKKNG